jgi:hypothetical protein
MIHPIKYQEKDGNNANPFNYRMSAGNSPVKEQISPGKYRSTLPVNKLPSKGSIKIIQVMPAKQENTEFYGDESDHRSKILMLEGIYIKEKMDFSELITGCDMENQYYVYAKMNDKLKKQGKKLYKCQEKSNWISRNCTPTSCRLFKMKIENLGEVSKTNRQCLLLEKQCDCGLLCFNRPNIRVTYIENNENLNIGKVVYAYSCLEYCFKIFGKDDKLRFKITANCCQCGNILPRFPCSCCDTVDFVIYDNDSKSQVSKLIKKNKSCLKENLTYADNFGLSFTPR